MNSQQPFYGSVFVSAFEIAGWTSVLKSIYGLESRVEVFSRSGKQSDAHPSLPEPPWKLIAVRTPESWEKKDLSAPPYEYRFLVREGADTRSLLLASENTDLVGALVARLGWTSALTRPFIKTAKLVEHLVEQRGSYNVGGVYCRVDGFGRSLRNASFFGDDLADAALFRDVLSNLTAYRVQLRKPSGPEIITIGSNGDVGLRRHDAAALADIDECFRFLKLYGFAEGFTLVHPEDNGGEGNAGP